MIKLFDILKLGKNVSKYTTLLGGKIAINNVTSKILLLDLKKINMGYVLGS